MPGMFTGINSSINGGFAPYMVAHQSQLFKITKGLSLEAAAMTEPLAVALQTVFDTGRLAGTGYVSILPVDQGIEHSGGASFAPNPAYFDPEKIVELAIEEGASIVRVGTAIFGPREE